MHLPADGKTGQLAVDQLLDPQRLLTVQVSQPAGSKGERGWLVQLRGELDIATLPLATAMIEDALRHGCRQLTVDLAGASFIGSAGLTALAQAAAAAREQGHQLTVRGLSLLGQRIAEILNLRIVLAPADPPASDQLGSGSGRETDRTPEHSTPPPARLKSTGVAAGWTGADP